MKIYTKTGDKGTTSLVGGTRINKDDIRLEAYGTIDELNSWIGFIISLLSAECRGRSAEAEVKDVLVKIQNTLFDLGCALATEKEAKWQPKQITDEDIMLVEKEIDLMENELPRHDKFILPGGTQSASAAHIARTVCRRAERIMVALPADSCPSQKEALAYVNRLSDYLFVLARYLNHKAGETETFWQP